jgi:hypothetical protein
MAGQLGTPGMTAIPLPAAPPAEPKGPPPAPEGPPPPPPHSAPDLQAAAK